MSLDAFTHRWKHDVGLRRSVSLHAIIGCTVLFPVMTFFTFAELKDPGMCFDRYPELPFSQTDAMDVETIRYLPEPSTHHRLAGCRRLGHSGYRGIHVRTLQGFSTRVGS